MIRCIDCLASEKNLLAWEKSGLRMQTVGPKSIIHHRWRTWEITFKVVFMLE